MHRVPFPLDPLCHSFLKLHRKMLVCRLVSLVIDHKMWFVNTLGSLLLYALLWLIEIWRNYCNFDGSLGKVVQPLLGNKTLEIEWHMLHLYSEWNMVLHQCMIFTKTLKQYFYVVTNILKNDTKIIGSPASILQWKHTDQTMSLLWSAMGMTHVFW